MLPPVTEAVERALAAADEAQRRTNAFLALAPERARAAAAAVREGAPLAGMPVAVKDNLCVAGLPAVGGHKKSLRAAASYHHSPGVSRSPGWSST